MFCFRRDPDARLGVGVAFTTATVDVGDGRDRDGRDADLARVSAEIGVPVAIVSQVHGADVYVVESLGDAPVQDLTHQQADALVATQPGAAVGVRVADCVPICLATEDGAAVAAVHAGRRGLLVGVIGATVARLNEVTDAPVHAWVGPHICAQCYELPEDLAAETSRLLGIAPTHTRWGTPSLDLGGAAQRQLDAAGVTSEFAGGCTHEEASLHSYRRDGAAAGRLLGAVWMGRP